MKTKLVLLLLLGWARMALGQNVVQIDTIYDSDRVSNPRFDELNMPYKQYHQVLSLHDPIQYLVWPYFSPAKDRMKPLEDREGQEGYWLEGDLNYRFNLYKGAYYSPKWAKRLRATFDAGFTVRMTQDTSSPLLPSNNRFGLGADYLLSDNDIANSSFYSWLTLQVHHYSNGQSDNDFLHTSGQRNNYMGGDFSTNYIRGLIYLAKPCGDNKLISFGLGYQKDMALGGPFKLSGEMDNGSYGLNRLLLNLQWVRKPSFMVIEKNREINKRVLAKNPKMSFRSEMSLITDDNLVALAPTNKKYRFGVHNYLTYYLFEKSNVGLIIRHYYGRDYLNIRYDDVVHSIQTGFTVDVNRYY